MPLMLNSKLLHSSQYFVDCSSNILYALSLSSLYIDPGNCYKRETEVLADTNVWHSSVLGPHSEPLCREV